MSTPAPSPQTPSEPAFPAAPDEPLAPTPTEPTVPLPPETAPAPAGVGVEDSASGGSGDDSAGAFAGDDGEAIGTAEMDADNAVEQDMIDAIDPAGRPD